MACKMADNLVESIEKTSLSDVSYYGYIIEDGDLVHLSVYLTKDLDLSILHQDELLSLYTAEEQAILTKFLSSLNLLHLGATRTNEDIVYIVVHDLEENKHKITGIIDSRKEKQRDNEVIFLTPALLLSEHKEAKEKEELLYFFHIDEKMQVVPS